MQCELKIPLIKCFQSETFRALYKYTRSCSWLNFTISAIYHSSNPSSLLSTTFSLYHLLSLIYLFCLPFILYTICIVFHLSCLPLSYLVFILSIIYIGQWSFPVHNFSCLPFFLSTICFVTIYPVYHLSCLPFNLYHLSCLSFFLFTIHPIFPNAF